MSYYGKTLGFFRTAGYDSDAAAFFTGAGITDAGEKDAWNTFVQGRKGFGGSGYYSKFYVIHPYIGGDSTKHSYNAINTATAQLSYSGGLTHNSNGMTGNGTDGYATFTFSQATNFSSTNGSMGVYVRSVGGGAIEPYLFTDEYSSYLAYLASDSNVTFGEMGNASGGSIGGSETTGFHSLNIESTDLVYYDKNGFEMSYDVSGTPPSFGGSNVLIFNYIDAIYAASNICFDYQANSLTSSEMADLISAVQTLQTSLGRQV